MTTVKFIATTLTSKGRFGKGDVSTLFTDDEAKDLQRLSSVESPEPTTVEEKAESVESPEPTTVEEKAKPEKKKNKEGKE